MKLYHYNIDFNDCSLKSKKKKKESVERIVDCLKKELYVFIKRTFDSGSFVYEKEGIFEGRVKSVHIPLERSVDIDTLHDFKIAECLFKNNVLKNGVVFWGLVIAEIINFFNLII